MKNATALVLIFCHAINFLFLHTNLQHNHLPFNNTKTLVILRPGKIKNHHSLRVKSALNKLTDDSRNMAIGPAGALIERVLTKARELEEMLSKNPSLSVNDEICVNIGLLEADLHAALSALRKKEEDLEEAERRILHEQAKLRQTKMDLERRELEIVAELAKQKQIEEDLKMANSNLASQYRQFKDLKLLVEDQSKKITDLHASLSLKEDEMCKLREELRKKDEDAEIMNSEIESKKQLLDETTEIIRKQEETIKDLQEQVIEKEHDLSESLQLQEVERERVKIIEAALEKQTMEWLLAQEEVKSLAAQLSMQMKDAKEASEDFKRVKALLSDLRSELISSQKTFASSQKKMEDRALLLEKEVAELQEQKLLVMSYTENLKDAQQEVEGERTKLRAAAAQFEELKSRLLDERKMVLHLKEEVHRERTAFEQQTQEITLLRKELLEKELDYSSANKLLQVKESELEEARLIIEEMKSEQASIQRLLQEKGADLLKAQKALAEVHNDIVDLQKLLTSKEQQLVQVTMTLTEKEDHIFITQHELEDTKIKFSEAISLMEKISQLSNKLVVSAKNEDIGTYLEQLEKEMFPDIKQKQLEAELRMVKELLREKEMDLFTAQRTLAAKDEELSTLDRRWAAREKEMEKKEGSWKDADSLEKLYILAQERIGDTTLGDLVTQKLQLEAVQLDAEAATSALQRIHDLTSQLVEMANLDSSLGNKDREASDNGLIVFGEFKGVEVAEKEITRLLELTETLVQEAGILTPACVVT